MPERAERFRDFADSGLPPDSRGTVVTVGTFDGVHRGHRDVLSRLALRARELSLDSVLITFDPHPLEIVNPAAAPALLTVGAEKLEALAESGVDYAAIVPFTAALASYDAARFVDDVLRRRFRMRHLVIGYDHGFGRAREGDVDVLRALGAERGFGVEVVPPVAMPDGRAISSTLVRRAVSDGDLAQAALALGRSYSVSATVVHGDGRGRSLGFPTINLSTAPARKLLPPEGVYAVRAQTRRGAFGGMMNLGPRPTFGDMTTSLEAFLFDANGDLYDQYVRVEFIARLRDTRKFDGRDALVAQLRRDEIDARNALAVGAHQTR